MTQPQRTRIIDHHRRITGHTVILDNMGFGGLVHPYACIVARKPLDCPVTNAIVRGQTHGASGKGQYHVALDADEDAVLFTDPLDNRYQPEWEIADLLDAFAREVGLVRALASVGVWVQEQRNRGRDVG